MGRLWARTLLQKGIFLKSEKHVLPPIVQPTITLGALDIWILAGLEIRIRHVGASLGYRLCNSVAIMRI